MKRLALPTLLLAAGALLSSGCVYRMSIQQGNYLVADSVSQLKEGMTRSQVRFLLGTPMVPDAFNDEKVARYENLGVPTQSDVEQVERDLRKALAETKKKREKRSLWQRMFGRDKPAETTTDSSSSDSKSAAEQKPDPVPPSAPVIPLPAGTPSGQQ